MSDSLETLGRKITGAGELESVVHTMKVLAASSITQYENAVKALGEYYRTVELGLALSFRRMATMGLTPSAPSGASGKSCVIVFGSDLGLVGRFNEILFEYLQKFLRSHGEPKTEIWTVGDRLATILDDGGYNSSFLFPVPDSVDRITPLIGRILVEVDTAFRSGRIARFYFVHHSPRTGGGSAPEAHSLLPLDEVWRNELAALEWPTQYIPEITGNFRDAQSALIREFLFVSLFRACAGSLASENASRLAAMQRAEKNIGEMLEDLHLAFHRLRQDSIDEELFDIIAGSEALRQKKKPR